MSAVSLVPDVAAVQRGMDLHPNQNTKLVMSSAAHHAHHRPSPSTRFCAGSAGNPPNGKFESLVHLLFVAALSCTVMQRRALILSLLSAFWAFTLVAASKGSALSVSDIPNVLNFRILILLKAGDLSVVTCGSVIKLSHIPSGLQSATGHSLKMHQNCSCPPGYRLHSHEVKYGSGSGQQSVTGFILLFMLLYKCLCVSFRILRR